MPAAQREARHQGAPPLSVHRKAENHVLPARLLTLQGEIGCFGVRRRPQSDQFRAFAKATMPREFISLPLRATAIRREPCARDEGNEAMRTMNIPRLLTCAEVVQLTGIGRSALYARIARGEFPPPVKFGRSSRWTEADVLSVISGAIAARDARSSP